MSKLEAYHHHTDGKTEKNEAGQWYLASEVDKKLEAYEIFVNDWAKIRLENEDYKNRVKELEELSAGQLVIIKRLQKKIDLDELARD